MSGGGGGGGGTGNGQAHRGHLEVSDDDSEYNSSMDRRGDRLVKPSQIKKNRSQGENKINNNIINTLLTRHPR